MEKNFFELLIVTSAAGTVGFCATIASIASNALWICADVCTRVVGKYLQNGVP